MLCTLREAMLNPELKRLLRQKLKEQPLERKRRRGNTGKIAPKPPEPQPIASDSSDDLEDVPLGHNESLERDNVPQEQKEDDPQKELPELDDFSNDYQLEDVDLEPVEQKPETLTFTVSAPEPEKKTRVTITKGERQRRKLVHKTYLVCMVCHGIVRNRWCNNAGLQRRLKQSVSEETAKLFHQDKEKVLDYVKTRRFVEGLRILCHLWSKSFKISNSGISKYDWGQTADERRLENVTLKQFKKLIYARHGSRDLAAQGFVACLRALGVNARLVFLLQPPDFRSVAPPKKKEMPKPKTEFDPVFIPMDAKEQLLRKSRQAESSGKRSALRLSPFPVFWIEAWNKYSKKWITIDPFVFETVETIPMRRNNRFKAPETEPTNQTRYVLSFDKYGLIKDVTRRYTQYYNGKVSKKRITHNEEDALWFERLLHSSKYTTADAYEAKEFHDRDISEGFPNNLLDFKNHPMYALESQLRQDEVIHPNDDSSKCGMFRSVNKSTMVQVYKRSHVFRLRTAKAWYMRGRVLKVGERPLKTKMKDDEEERLYAEFQTQIYQAPPIVDGKITKNAYGNVEIFAPWMVPENGYLYKAKAPGEVKLGERAARELGIDHARAIVAFDFTGPSKKRAPAAQTGGVLVAKEFQEAFEAVIEALKDLAEEEVREKARLNALKGWKFILARLRIKKRLDQTHGRVDGENENEPAFDDAFENQKIGLSEEGGFEPGGFEPNFEEGGFEPGLESKGFEPEFEPGGFEPGGFEPGGFEPDLEEGGFEPGGFEKLPTKGFEAGGTESSGPRGFKEELEDEFEHDVFEDAQELVEITDRVKLENNEASESVKGRNALKVEPEPETIEISDSEEKQPIETVKEETPHEVELIEDSDYDDATRTTPEITKQGNIDGRAPTSQVQAGSATEPPRLKTEIGVNSSNDAAGFASISDQRVELGKNRHIPAEENQPLNSERGEPGEIPRQADLLPKTAGAVNPGGEAQNPDTPNSNRVLEAANNAGEGVAEPARGLSPARVEFEPDAYMHEYDFDVEEEERELGLVYESD